MNNNLAEALERNLNRTEHHRSKSGAPLFFEEDYISDRYAKLFGIEDRKQFLNAFRTVTEGLGNELPKINSIASSSLLSLLVFFPLYCRKATLTLKLGQQEVKFNKCFFEARNKVIRRPSCVDVVLVSEDGGTLLYLESKLSEFEDMVSSKEYGQGYSELYTNHLKEFFDHIGFSIEKNDKKVKVKSSTKAYIEGIKQTISHLIGLIKGPKHEKNDAYDSKEYEAAYKKAQTLFYGTILFNPAALHVDSSAFIAYKNLYKQFASESKAICEQIQEWANQPKISKSKEIVVLPNVLTYQTLPWDYMDALPNAVKSFYGLKKA